MRVVPQQKNLASLQQYKHLCIMNSSPCSLHREACLVAHGSHRPSSALPSPSASSARALQWWIQKDGWEPWEWGWGRVRYPAPAFPVLQM
jgi:hypothetical protein